MKILKQLNKNEITEVKELFKICKIERVPNFDPSIYIDPQISSFYLEYKDDLLIGFLSLFYVDTKEMEIVSAIHPSYRGKGYFTKLFMESKKNIPDDLLIIFQIPSNYVDKTKLTIKGFSFHHGEEELINKTPANSTAVLNKLKKEDINATAKLLAEAFDDNISEEIDFLELLIDQKTSTPMILKENNSIIGFIAISNSFDVKTSHVFAFCVDKNYRSMGYGKKMLCNLPPNKYGYVLRVEYNNPRAKKLYTRSGFIHLSSTEYYTKID